MSLTVEAQLRWGEQGQKAAASALSWILQFRRLTKPSTGVNSKLMRQLYLAVTLPKMTYGLDVWYTPPRKPTEAAKSTGSVAALKAFQKVQRVATLAITGALRTTPNNFLNTHAGVLLVELALLKVCYQAMVRMLTLPDTHPLHEVARKAQNTQPVSHPSPIDNLLMEFRLAEEHIEVITPVKCLPALVPSFSIEIAKSRKDSVQNEKTDEADYRIYSDGSGHNGKIGASAVIYKKGCHRPVGHRKARLGDKSRNTTFEGEVVGAILAVWLLRHTPGTLGKKVSVFTDNQAVLQAIRAPKALSGQYLIRQLIEDANAASTTVSFKWISGHTGVCGNEEADRLAKEAAEGNASRRTDLPPMLRSSLPLSASAAKQDYMEHLKQC